ncbi:glycosyltransferase family 4 protein [Hymenobacter norwichensis]|uniref:glycosyltransferase family 4 protein n=1 Tax=Hymenobacter norwichensis TaxID=223903 RepID=UPI0003B7BB22|nr:glycosyltransferase family 4 protein [Hymenobacter norwichensis]
MKTLNLIKSTIYIVGHYRAGAADGLAEFNYRITQVLRDEFSIQFIEFDSTKDSNYHNTESKENVLIHVFGAKDRSKFQLPSGFQKWLAQVDNTNCVFHLSHIYNIDNYLVSRQLKRLSIPFIITPHDSFVYDPAYMQARPLLKRWYRNAFVSVFDKYVLDNATVVHGISEMCAAHLGNVTKNPVSVVTNQVNDMQIAFDAASLKEQVCFIGRFDIFRKGIDIALDAFHLFKEQSSNAATVTYVLIGPADEQAAKEREAICQRLHLRIGQDVIFTNKIPEPERNALLAQSKVYMQLSRTEGFGLSIAQALSCYKPVVVSTQVPIHDKIVAHKAGFAVHNADEAAQALTKLFALSPAEYLAMAHNARRCYEQEFHPDVIKPQLVGMYEKAAGVALNS